jgi:hypothetical protein
VCFLSVVLTRASKLLEVARATGIEHAGAVIPSHVRVRAGVEELSRDLRVTLLAGDEQRRNTPERRLVDWRTMGQQQVHEGGVVVASSKVQTGIRSLRALPLESRRDICPVRQEQLDDFLVILFARPCQREVTFLISGVYAVARFGVDRVAPPDGALRRAAPRGALAMEPRSTPRSPRRLI